MSQTIIHFADGAVFGGVERILLTLVAGLDRSRWRSLILHHDDPGIVRLVDSARSLGIETRVVPRMHGNSGVLRLPQLVRTLRAERASIFHAHLNWPLACTYGIAAAALARIPGIVATQQLFVPIRSPHRARLQRVVARWVDRYIAVSDGVARMLRETGVPARKIVVVHNGVNPAAFRCQSNLQQFRSAVTKGTKRHVVLTVARLDSQKGLRYLLEAAPLVPDAVFVVAGEGSRRAKLEAQAQTLGITDRVLFLGERHDIPELLANCDVFVLPSLYEGLPVSVLEAMAAGKPVIATDIEGTNEVVVPGETGLLVPPEDPDALATSIRALLSDHVLGDRLGAAGKIRMYSKFSNEAMIEGVVRGYERVLVSRRKAAAADD